MDPSDVDIPAYLCEATCQCHSIWIERGRMIFKVVYSEKCNCYWEC